MQHSIKRKLRRLSLASCLTIGIGLVVQSGFAQPPQAESPQGRARQESIDQMIETQASMLNITQEQMPQFRGLMRATLARIMPLAEQIANETGNERALQARIRAIGEEANRQLAELLTAEQMNAFVQLQQEDDTP